MKKYLLLGASLLALTSAAAYAGQQSRANLTTDVGTNLADSSDITASELRTELIDMIDSSFNLLTDDIEDIAVTSDYILFSSLDNTRIEFLSAFGGLAGSDTQVQFNDAGVFGADAGLVYNKTTDVLTVVDLVGDDVSLTGNAHAAGTLFASAGATITGDLSGTDLIATDDLSVAGTMFVSSTATLSTTTLSTATVTTDLTVSDDLSVAGVAFVSGALTASAGATITGDATVSDDLSVTGILYASAGAVTLQQPSTKTTDYTLVAGDEAMKIVFDCAANCTVTVPGATFATGTEIDILKFNSASTLTFASSNIMLYTTDSLVFASNYSGATLYFYSSDGAFIFGKMASP